MDNKIEEVQTTLRLPNELNKKIGHISIDLNISKNEFMLKAIEKYIKEMEKQK